MGRINPIVFPLTPDLVTLYDTNANIGLIRDNNLVLPILPEDYEPEDNEETEILRGFTSSVVNVKTRFVGFSATTKDSRIAIYHILKALQDTAEAVTGVYAPVTCYDYHRVEPADIATGYTIRQGVLTVALAGGSFRGGSGYDTPRYTQGTRFNFRQV